MKNGEITAAKWQAVGQNSDDGKYMAIDHEV
jgi:hypothetical protein